jgi:uncharacterized protein (TIGR00725 family)
VTRTRQVAVIGSSGGGSELEEAAKHVGTGLAEAGLVVVCGGLTGVMEAVARGAAEAGGVVIGIIPGESTDEANPHCTHVVATGIGYARNLAVVASGEAVVAVGGEWGTLSEIGFARNLGRPVIALRSWSLKPAGGAELDGVTEVEDPVAAVEAVRAALKA